MATNKKKSKPMRIIQPNAAGIDIGVKEIYIALPEGRGESAVRKFGCFTDDLIDAARWMRKRKIQSIAMESTGVYWIPIYQVLESFGFELFLVNARHVKNVPGRKTDVKDAQWLQYLHSVGLLSSSYIPENGVCVIRTFLRHRESLIKMASTQVQHTQKALTQMNLQLNNVISDITGVTGLKIINSILDGNHDPKSLSELKNKRIRVSKTVIQKSLTGNYRIEHLFTLRQSLESYQFYTQRVTQCDREIEKQLNDFDSKENMEDEGNTKPEIGPKQRRVGNSPSYDLQGHMFRIFGTDLTRIDGISSVTAQALFGEIGPNLDKFPTSKHFCSWLGLSPENKITGGRIISSRTKKSSNKAAQSPRVAAGSLTYCRSYLGDYYRKMKARHGAPKAITAAAHKIARIIFVLIKNGIDYDESVFKKEEIRLHKRKLRSFKNMAKHLGFQIVATGSQEVVT